MGIRQEISRIVKQREKELKDREKIYYKHCKRCRYGYIARDKREAKEWDHVHGGHKKEIKEVLKEWINKLKA